MHISDTSARDEAIAWAVRAHAESFEDWDGLAEWLAADPRHAELYDRATIAAEEGVSLIHDRPEPAETPLPAVVVPISVPVRRRASAWVLTGLAASIVALVAGTWALHGVALSDQSDLYAIATRPGETRAIALDDKSHVLLGGGSRIVLDRSNPRFAALETGEALFTVTHDAARPFRVKAGEAGITDIGTVFDVERDDRLTTVSVAEGAVHIVASGGEADARAGQMVTIDAGRQALVRRDQDPALVGSWRQGRIDFADITLRHLADRLQRATGQRMRVAPDLLGRHVSGSVQLGSDMAATLRQLSVLLDIAIERRGDAWVWSKDARAGSS